ncbi:cyclase family protein [Streptomyces syringium]|uniref:cyclase family protein n=1 Tax=Streptomyces syringium TaxID=76729 RepID=UPI003AACC909
MTDTPPPRTTAADPLLAAIAAGTVVHDLAQPLENGMPCSPNHPGFRMALLRRHGDGTRPDGSSAANELIVTGGHVGTHIDALSHASHHGRLFGGHDAAEAQQGGRFSVHGIDTVPPMFCRGVLLDVAAAHGTDVLEAGYGITDDDLEHAAARAGAVPGEQDVCLVRTGWARRWSDTEAYIGHTTGVPGLTESAATWLADRGVRAIGADTTAVEQIPAGQGHTVLPVHRTLLVDRGVHLIEHMNLETLAAAGATEFLFVLSPLKITGGTGSPVRPLAVLTTADSGHEEQR